jgi:hypothetical protein
MNEDMFLLTDLETRYDCGLEKRQDGHIEALYTSTIP